MNVAKKVNSLLSRLNIKIIRLVDKSNRNNDIITDENFMTIYDKCKPYTMTSIERMYCLYQSVNYILRNEIAGDFVECGVWKGGSSMLIALILEENKIYDRKLIMYDTYEGMSKPTNEDLDATGLVAMDMFKDTATGEDSSAWCNASLEEVKRNLASTNYPNIFYIQGKVEDTIPSDFKHKEIALLRLDTDWYESTKHELEYLYPKLVKEGVLIIDDYGFWAGAKKAVDNYLIECNVKKPLIRIDNTGRILIK